VRYFESYFHWYNTEHLHSGIDYVTPEQCHRGLKDQIVAERKTKLGHQRQWRKLVNNCDRNLCQAQLDTFTPLSTRCPVA
jgi:hypothetical protein